MNMLSHDIDDDFGTDYSWVYECLWEESKPLDHKDVQPWILGRQEMKGPYPSGLRYFEDSRELPNSMGRIESGLIALSYKFGLPKPCGVWNLPFFNDGFMEEQYFKSESGTAAWIDNPSRHVLLSDTIHDAVYVRKPTGYSTLLVPDQLRGFANLVLPPLPLAQDIKIVVGDHSWMSAQKFKIFSIAERWRHEGRKVQFVQVEAYMTLFSKKNVWF